MQYLNPSILWGLLALVIPIIIHLFYFRRYKKVSFTNVDFLAELKEEKSVRNKLRRFLILLSRLLAMAFIIFAFARPFLPGDDQSSSRQNVVSLYVDNSYSMNAYGQDASLLDEAKRIASEIINTYPAETEFQIIPNSTSAEYQRLHSKSDATDLLEDIEPTPEVLTLSEIQQLQYQLLSKEEEYNKSLYYISDFQKSISDLQNTTDSSYHFYLVPLSSEKNENISIDSVWLESPVMQSSQANTLYVSITNHGTTNISDARLTIEYEGSTKPAGVLEIPAGETIIDTLAILPQSGGWSQAQVNISDFPIQFDNSYYIAFDVPKKLNILTISDPRDDLTLGKQVNNMNYLNIRSQTIDKVNFGEFNTYDLILLNDLNSISSGLMQELEIYMRGGGKLLLFPPETGDITDYNLFLNRVNAPQFLGIKKGNYNVYSLNEKAFVFRNVYQETDERLSLPTTQQYYDLNTRSTQATETLMKLRNGDTYLTQVAVDNGFLYLSASSLSLSSNSLSNRVDIFAPMLYRMALQRSANTKLSYTIGKDNIITIPRPVKTLADEPVRMIGNREFIPAQQRKGAMYMLDLSQSEPDAGFYDVMLEGEIIRKIALNYDRKESIIENESISSLNSRYPSMKIIDNSQQKQINNYLATASLGIELWWYFIIIALVFLAIEQFLIRFMKND